MIVQFGADRVRMHLSSLELGKRQRQARPHWSCFQLRGWIREGQLHVVCEFQKRRAAARVQEPRNNSCSIRTLAVARV